MDELAVGSLVAIWARGDTFQVQRRHRVICPTRPHRSELKRKLRIKSTINFREHELRFERDCWARRESH